MEREHLVEIGEPGRRLKIWEEVSETKLAVIVFAYLLDQKFTAN